MEEDRPEPVSTEPYPEEINEHISSVTLIQRYRTNLSRENLLNFDRLFGAVPITYCQFCWKAGNMNYWESFQRPVSMGCSRPSWSRIRTTTASTNS